MTNPESVEEWHKLLIEEDIIPEDTNVLSYLIIIGALKKGVNKKKVKAWLGSYVRGQTERFNEMWATARAQRIFVGDKISVSDVDKGMDDVELILNAMCLDGLIERSPEPVAPLVE